MKYFYFLWILLAVFFSANLRAETPGTMAQDAQKAYEAGNYPQAIQKWEELRSLGYLNGSLFYNLGNASWQMGQGGRARWYYLRGMKLAPRNAELHNNLEFIDGKLGLTKAEPVDGPWGWFKGLPWWMGSLSFFESLQIGAALSLLFFAFLFLNLWRGNRPSKWLFVFFGIPFFVFLCVITVQGWRFYFSGEGVVLNSGAELLSAPATEAKTGQNIPEGTIVPMVKKQGDFRLIKTPSGGSAWLEADQVGPIQL